MKEQYLETDDFPFAYFEILSVENMPEKIISDSVYTVIGDGHFYLHGIQKKLKPELTIMVPSGKGEGLILVMAKFHILLEDYDIERPQLVLLKVAKQINIQIKFSAFQTETIENIILPSIYD